MGSVHGKWRQSKSRMLAKKEFKTSKQLQICPYKKCCFAGICIHIHTIKLACIKWSLCVSFKIQIMQQE
jgi:hypothetical protein